MLTASYNLQAPINHYGLSQQGITLVKNRSHSDCKLVSTGVDICKVPSIFFFPEACKGNDCISPHGIILNISLPTMVSIQKSCNSARKFGFKNIKIRRHSCKYRTKH